MFECSDFEVEVINLLNMLLLISKEQLFSGFKFVDLSLKELDFLEKGIKLYFGVGRILSINLNKFPRRYPGSIKFIGVAFSG